MDADPRQPSRRDALAAFLVVSAVSALLTSGNVRSADYWSAMSVAVNLVESGSLEATPVPGHDDFATMPGPDGRRYSRFGLGHSLLGVPAALAAPAVAAAWDGPLAALDLPQVRFYAADDPALAVRGLLGALSNAPILGALAAALVLLAGALGLPRRTALLAALLAGIASPLLFLASDLMAEPACALALVLLALSLRRLESADPAAPPPAATALSAGLALGSLVLLKIAHGVLLPVGAAALLLALPPAHRRSPRAWGPFAAGVALNLALVAAYNVARFGQATQTGYTDASQFGNPVLEGALGQLFSPGRGLFLYFPAAALALAGLPALLRRSRAVAVLCAGALAALWILYAPWHAWEGGWTWGPRLLGPALGLLALPAALAAAGTRTRALRLAAGAVLAASLAVALSAFLVDYIDYSFYLWRLHGAGTDPVIRWSLSDAPLVAYPAFAARRGLLLASALRHGLNAPLAVLFGTSLAALLAGAVLLLRGPSRAR